MPAQIGDGDARRFRHAARTDRHAHADYKALTWVEPEIVQVPSTHFKGAIYAKFYEPADYDASKKHPAVMFVHGAGYLQNVHLAIRPTSASRCSTTCCCSTAMSCSTWTTAHPRATAATGALRSTARWAIRNWKTCSTARTGWSTTQSVDAKRVGIYGGSYGGFMTLMALFRAPGEFAAGAALRPVTDWTQYNHEYTSDILNDPQIDPIAYQRSSPIEFADGLKDPLLICHGVIDDNVLFEDSMRLYQRLIELHKDNFTISPYPLDRHGFTNADSWLDEYKRIYRLFEANLK